MLFAPQAHAASGFTIKFPTIPFPPLIKSVTGPGVGVCGKDTAPIIAQIVGQTILTGRCKDDSSSCDSSLIEQIKDPTVFPNPPEIKAAWINWSKLDTSSKPTTYPFNQVAMTYNSTTMKWEGKISIPTSYCPGGDKIVYFITAVDSRGNVATEIPTTTVAQSVPNKWEDKYATPIIDNCKYANKTCEYGNLSGCEYTVNSCLNDIWLSTLINSLNNGATHSAILPAKTDIRGISAAMDGTFAYVKMGLGDQSNNPPEIEGFMATIFNPDIADSNPVDSYTTNAFGASYAPEAITVGNGLDIALWSVKCLTTPGKSTEELLNCRLISGAKAGKLEVGPGTGNNLYYKIKKSGAGELVAESYSFMGSSKVMYLTGSTGEIVVTPTGNFWLNDMTNSMAFYSRNKTLVISKCGGPPFPYPTNCSVTCNGVFTNVCSQATSPLADYDECKITFNDGSSIDVTQYKIYRSTNEDFSGGTAKYNIPKGTPPYSQTDKITNLDGTTYYYYVTSKGSYGETFVEEAIDPINGCFGTCETRSKRCGYSIYPYPFSVPYTPVGEEGSCKLTWTYDTSCFLPPVSFKIYRDSSATPITTIIYDSSTDTFTFTDTGLTIGQKYRYRIVAYKSSTDKSFSDELECIPEDRKPPAPPSGLSVISKPNNTIGLLWSPNLDPDIKEYKIYKCEKTPDKNCDKADDFIYHSSTTAAITYADIPFTPADNEKTMCFYIETADNCYNTHPKTCPSNTKNNGSGFPKDITKSIKCLSPSENEWWKITTFTHKFPFGWNLVGIPFLPSTTNPKSVFNTKISNIYSYKNGEYVTDNSIESLAPGRAYWVYFVPATDSENITINVKGTVSIAKTVPVVPGWNTISVPYNKSVQWNKNIKVQDERGNEYSLDDPLSLSILASTDIYKPDKLNSEDCNKFFDCYTKISIMEGKTIEPWEGFLIRSKTKGKIVFP